MRSPLPLYAKTNYISAVNGNIFGVLLLYLECQQHFVYSYSCIQITHNCVRSYETVRLEVRSQRSYNSTSPFENANNKINVNISCWMFNFSNLFIYFINRTNCFKQLLSRFVCSMHGRFNCKMIYNNKWTILDHCVVNYKTIHIMWFYHFKSL